MHTHHLYDFEEYSCILLTLLLVTGGDGERAQALSYIVMEKQNTKESNDIKSLSLQRVGNIF